MNSKVLALLLVLVLVNMSIGLPLDELVEQINGTQSLSASSPVADGYYETCVWACVKGVCVRKCW